MMSTAIVAALLALLTFCQASPFFPFGFGLHSAGAQPRCPSTSKPCRIKVEMAASLESVIGNQASESHPCSCPDSKPCSSDWSDPDHVISRELRTASNIRMTLSMMFCDVIQPQRQCGPDEVALQVAGYSLMPTEVDYVNCACTERRPLVLHEQYYGADHRQYMSYVCWNFKPRCTVGWGPRQTCLSSDPETHRMSYPCKCPYGYSCRANALEGSCQRE